ncbi:hypothetical protein L596_000035 [Steinernema carpocapsae]|uniref:Uncharacterized protein n=1 Tax=Steinernema carpocapsae TaxID=34508 RepID=A0A4U8UGY7_STECR|nr:hypothetical protein L596_000035 [Steinernema carpocapsae]
MCFLDLSFNGHPKFIGVGVGITELGKLLVITWGLIMFSSEYQLNQLIENIWNSLLLLLFWMITALGLATLAIGLFCEHTAFLVPTLASQTLTIIIFLLLPYFREVWIISSCMVAFTQLLILLFFLICYVDIDELEQIQIRLRERDSYTSIVTVNGRAFGTKLYQNNRTKRYCGPITPMQRLNEIEDPVCQLFPNVTS